jgi:nicotinic acid mononucleotide adenylyltransferase
VNTVSISIPQGAGHRGTAVRAAHTLGSALVAWSQRERLPLSDEEIARRHDHLRMLDAAIAKRDAVVHPLMR